MSPSIIAFVVGVFVGVVGGIFFIGILQMGKERVEFQADEVAEFHAVSDN
jgi:hypothetical protein